MLEVRELGQARRPAPSSEVLELARGWLAGQMNRYLAGMAL
jgi:hypothetical protein